MKTFETMIAERSIRRRDGLQRTRVVFVPKAEDEIQGKLS
jgi:hypothetical protein